MRTRIRLAGAVLLAAMLGGCAGLTATVGDPYVAPGKFGFLRCPDLATRLETAEARHRELLALMERSGAGVGGSAVNMFVYRPDMDAVEAELFFIEQTAAEKSCTDNAPTAPPKPEAGMGPIH
ncbi:MAG: twin-arginine translocation pathway signal [Xanthobacteraceae bacterium]|nr:twin-arginine translocation pathway signal [Xanthobacteraceae bacterium]